MASRAHRIIAWGFVAACAGACSGAQSSTGFGTTDGAGGGSGESGSTGGASSGGTLSGGTSDGGTTAHDDCVQDSKNAEVADNGCDDDADGTVDNVPVCDSGLAIDGAPDAFARAIGVCDVAASRGFGLVSATYTNGFGRTARPHDGQWGILSKFGSVITAREGEVLGVLSSGYAREFDTLDTRKVDFTLPPPLNGERYPTGAAPVGYPKPAAGCQQDDKVNDMIDLKLVMKAPPNAKGFTFDFNFHSSEWPIYICSPFNDSFIAYLSSSAYNGGRSENVSFDSKKNPVSVNNGFFDRCTPGSVTGCDAWGGGGGGGAVSQCPGGSGELEGTGFGLKQRTCDKVTTLGGSTGWLTTSAPVAAGEQFTIEFMVWDTGDGVLDSSVLLDKFRWVGAPVDAGTVRPPR